MKKSRFQFTLFLLLFSTLLFSCESQKVAENAIAQEANWQNANKHDCKQGDIHKYELGAADPTEAQIAAGIDYIRFTETGPQPFYSSDCLCDVFEYKIIFESLPANQDLIKVFDINGAQYTEFYCLYQEGADFLVIPDPDQFPDPNMTVFIDIDDEITPRLVYGGGLCMIDNLDFNYPPPGGPQYAPIKYYLPPTTYRAFIPEAITIPVI